MGNVCFNAVLNALFTVFGLVLLKLIVRREWAAVIVAILFFTFTNLRGLSDTGPKVFNVAVLMLVLTILVIAAQRLGLLAMAVLYFVNFVLSNAPLTFDVSKWFFADALLPVLLTVAIAGYGFYASRGREPLFGGPMLD
jgi:hypothetical protein